MKVLAKVGIVILLILSMGYAQNKLSVGLALHREKTFAPTPESFSQETDPRNYGDGGAIQAYLQYEPGQRLFFRSGFGFYETTQKSRRNNLVFPILIDPRNGAEGLFVESKIATGSLVIPLDAGLRLPVGTGKTVFLAGAGASLHMTISETRSTSAIGTSMSLEDIDPALQFDAPEANDVNVSLRVFTGVEFQANERLFFALEPYARFSPQRVSLDFFTGEERAMWDVGFTLRLRRK
jgi:hypothetical protein